MLAVAFVGAPAAGQGDLLPPEAGLEAREVVTRVEDNMRGVHSSTCEATMTVTSPRLPAPREVTFRCWEDRAGKRSFIRILAPAKDAGVGFLKIPPNLWNYIPRVERTVRIPPSMMMQSWMGSDFTNDDLVRESSVLDDYDHGFLGVDPAFEVDGEGPRRVYVIEYVPHEDAPVVWGRIVVWVDAERFVPRQQEFFDEDGTRLRRMTQSDVREVQGRFVPHRWVMVPLDKEGHETRLEYQSLRFDEPIDPVVFTKRNLARRD
jgi:outer membrane lipoprotein-sorting protein